jgi:glycerol-3-phosphate dehydrogenase (NAD(P)+)
MDKFGIIGGGAWGTALATVAARAGRQTTLWARESEVVDGINTTHRNPIYLPDVEIDEDIRATGDLAEAADADVLLLVPPAQHLRAVATQLKQHLSPTTALVICCKGIEQGTHAVMTEVLAEVLPNAPISVLSGPSFAREVALGLPTAATLACKDHELGHALARAIGQPMFRPYLSEDLIGVEIGGALKNVLAIACGVIVGRELGENARAALTTRGAAEITRLGIRRGGRVETFMGLAGFGDLILTCSSLQSRNMSLGAALGRGESLEDILSSRTSVSEGVYTASAVAEHARELEVEMPIVDAVDGILNHGLSIDDAIGGLLSRAFTTEY